MKQRMLIVGFALAAIAVARSDGGGESKIPRSDSKVKATATATKIANGKQTLTITLEIAKDWYIYANPVNYDQYENNRTRVTVKADGKVTADVNYPKGTKKDEKYYTYQGKVVIVCEVTRSPGDTSPLQVGIDVNSCGLVNMECLLPARIKLTIE